MKWARKWMLWRAIRNGKEVTGLLRITWIEAGEFYTHYPVVCISLSFHFQNLVCEFLKIEYLEVWYNCSYIFWIMINDRTYDNGHIFHFLKTSLTLWTSVVKLYRYPVVAIAVLRGKALLSDDLSSVCSLLFKNLSTFTDEFFIVCKSHITFLISLQICLPLILAIF